MGFTGGMPPPKPTAPVVPEITPRVHPEPGTAWYVVMAGTEDTHCSWRNEHAFNVMHALGINPNAPWPPETDEIKQMFDAPTVDEPKKTVRRTRKKATTA